jgi:ATP phosphoribosyltransferase regulatory subunit HisZ
MPRGIDPGPPRVETPAALREMAARARRLAQGMLDDQTIANMTAFAAELEARAAALEPAVQTISHDEAVAVQRSDPDLGQS